ncbi:hypothetical protein LCGC14_2964000 [marine sediment metagenome]|uniref:NADAR domain-containing protein n=1 Tax=marine sediment metagenome TaxID=412755 RepID=A0A0F8XC92_9ZZZZ
MSDIFFWTRHDKHGYCSNFYRSPVMIDDEVWPTVEHYYQAQKTFDHQEQTMILRCQTPLEAKFAGYHVKLRPDWEEVKERVMLSGLRAKFTQHPDLKEKLLATGDDFLHEDSPWDKYWGYVGGRGQDRLGKLLMITRDKLRGNEVEL